MATSSTYTMTVTGATLFTDVLQDLGVYAPGETPTDDDMQHAKRKANFLIKQLEGPPNFMAPGERMWQREVGSLTPDATKNSYSLKPSGGDLAIQIPEEIISVVLRHTASGSDSVLKEMTYAEYQALGNKSSSVTPTRYYYEKRTTEGKLYLNGKPTSSVASGYTLQVYYRQPMEVIVSLADEFDIVPEYYRMLLWNLVRELAPTYGVKATQDIKELARESAALANTFEPENQVLFFEPDREL